MENVTLAGMPFEEYKAFKTKVNQDAAKIISEAIDKAEKIVNKIVEGWDEKLYDLEAINIQAQEAKECLLLASEISGCTGVEYNLEYSSEYDNNGETITNKLDEMWSVLYNSIGKDLYNMQFSKLHSIAEDMEGSVRAWNASNC